MNAAFSWPLWRAEASLLRRQTLALFLIAVLLLLTLAALFNGARVVDAQLRVTDQREAIQNAHNAPWLSHFGESQEAGRVGYYYAHLADQPPPPAALFALGVREQDALLLRVRLLGLDGQLYESEQRNPELLAIGSFDFAFVLVYLAPLVLLVLLHDGQSGERESGRLPVLLSLAAHAPSFWWRRVVLRFLPVWAALVLPAMALAFARAVPLGVALGVVLISSLYLFFWTLLALVLTRAHWRSTVNASVLLAAWLLLTLVLPALAGDLIHRRVPVTDGMQLTLQHREAVHNAWDKPKQASFDIFFTAHPEWRDTPPVTERFHWKWYYAFQHAGDMQVADAVKQFHARIQARESLARRVGYVLPAAAVQSALHALTDTDQAAHLRWQNAVRAFHDRLRVHFYPWLFHAKPFLPGDLQHLPQWQAPAAVPRWQADVLLATAGLCALLLALARRQLGRTGTADAGQ